MHLECWGLRQYCMDEGAGILQEVYFSQNLLYLGLFLILILDNLQVYQLRLFSLDYLCNVLHLKSLSQNKFPQFLKRIFQLEKDKDMGHGHPDQPPTLIVPEILKYLESGVLLEVFL